MGREQASAHRQASVEAALYAMVDTTNAYRTISPNPLSTLVFRSRRSKCHASLSDTKVKARRSRVTRFSFPGTMVVRRLKADDDALPDLPVVIVGVASPSTRRTDAEEEVECDRFWYFVSPQC